MENVLEIKNISKEYKGFSLKDVSFNIPKGFVMGLIGPNGAGKTTTIKAIMNLINLDSGEIYIFGEDIKKNEILSGDLKENSALPSIRSLASELRVSVITTKRAYEELERDGFIYTLPGKGSYVAEQNKELLMEEKLREIEEKLGEAIDIANSIGLNFEELVGMLKTLKEL